MRNGKRIFGVALPAAVIAILGVQRAVESPWVQPRIVTRPVVVAVLDIPEGSAIGRTSVVVNHFPLGTVPAGAFASTDSVVGRIARINIYKGEAIVHGRLAQNTAPR